MTLDPNANPGRRMFEQARKLRRAKRAYLLRRGVTAVPTRPATVLQFPNKKEVTDGRQGLADLHQDPRRDA
jgi:hypothetical protein